MTIVEAAAWCNRWRRYPPRRPRGCGTRPAGRAARHGALWSSNSAGYKALLAWLETFGNVTKIGIEGGSYGSGLSRFLRRAGVEVIEVDRPNREERRRSGKSDPLDAVEAARAALSGRASGAPKSRDGAVEAIRVLVVRQRAEERVGRSTPRGRCAARTSPTGSPHRRDGRSRWCPGRSPHGWPHSAGEARRSGAGGQSSGS